MRLDEQNQFSKDQALSGAGNTASTNVIDLSIDRNIGIGKEMAVEITLDVAADDGDADETYVAILQTDSDSGFGSAVQVGATVTITRGDVAGTKYTLLLPKGTETDRYLRMYYTLGGSTPSVTLTAHLIPADHIEGRVNYASGYTVSSP